MTRVALALCAVLALPPVSRAAGETSPALTITINPEGRVSAALGKEVPTGGARGTPIKFLVLVVNQGFSTGRLEARLVGQPAAKAELDFQPPPLKGVPREYRSLWITLRDPQPVDVTIAFRLRSGDSDLGGRDRVHLLLRPQA